jgi:hypothetical protein
MVAGAVVGARDCAAGAVVLGALVGPLMYCGIVVGIVLDMVDGPLVGPAARAF